MVSIVLKRYAPYTVHMWCLHGEHQLTDMHFVLSLLKPAQRQRCVSRFAAAQMPHAVDSVRSSRSVCAPLDHDGRAAHVLLTILPHVCRLSMLSGDANGVRSREKACDANSIGDHSCQICFEYDHSTVMLPCGHGGVCWDCGVQMYALTGECPMCRNKIDLVSLDAYVRKYLVLV